MGNDLISIIIPVYNVEQYVEECLNSVINQTYHNIEIIIIDDGSTDSSGIICDEIAKKDSRIRVVHGKNQGIAAARNKGVAETKGRYIVFVDSDDVVDLNYIKAMYEVAVMDDADIVQCGLKRFTNQEDLLVNKKANLNDEKLYLTGREANQQIYRSGKIDYTVAWNKLYKRSLFDFIQFPEGRINEDTFTTFKLFYEANKVVVIPKRLYLYRVRKNSIMHKPMERRNLDMLDAYEHRLEYYRLVKDEELIHLCKERYMFSAIELYKRAVHSKSDNEIVSELFRRARTLFEDMLTEKLFYNKSSIIKYNFFVEAPKIYCGISEMASLIKRAYCKAQRKMSSICNNKL